MKIAFAGFGEVNTPIEVIERKCKGAVESLEKDGVELFPFYPIRDDYEETYVNKAVEYFSSVEFDVMVLCVAGWIPTHAILKVADKFRHKPMVLWGLCGWYEDGRLVTTADQAGTSACRKTMKDLGYTFKYVYDIVGLPSKADEVLSYAKAASVATNIRTVKIGQLGYRDMQLYGTQFDGVSVKRVFGVEIECFEMLEVVQRAEKLSQAEIDKVIDRIKAWKFVKQPNEDAVINAAKYYLAIKHIITERNYLAVSLKDVDGFKKLLGFPPAPIFTLLAEDGICTTPENDAMGNVTQVVVNGLTGQIGAYLEFYEYFSDGVLAGVPDYVPKEIVDGETTILPATFGELSQGLLNVSKVKTGKLTMARFTEEKGKYYLHMVVGDGETPPSWEECGWDKPAPQLPSLKIKLNDTDDFCQKVACQHYIICYGDKSNELKEFCKILDIEVV
jgi:L-fucose isomerase-like protein